KPGKYNVAATVNVNVNGQIAVNHSQNCKVTITVEEEPKQPEYKCESLTTKKLSRNRHSFTATGSATNGADITGYTYNFGDGTSTVTTTNRTVEHTYAKPGTYTAKVTVNVRANGQNKTTTGPKCEVKVTIEEEPKQPVYRCDSLAAQKL